MRERCTSLLALVEGVANAADVEDVDAKGGGLVAACTVVLLVLACVLREAARWHQHRLAGTIAGRDGPATRARDRSSFVMVPNGLTTLLTRLLRTRRCVWKKRALSEAISPLARS